MFSILSKRLLRTLVPVYCFVVICTGTILGQQNIQQIDSLKTVLEETTNLLQMAILKVEIAGKYASTKPDESIRLGKEAIPILMEVQHEQLAELYLILYHAYESKGDQKYAMPFLRRAKTVATRNNDKADIFNIMGTLHFGRDSMEYYYTQYFDIVRAHNLVEHIPNSYQQIGLVHAINGNTILADSLWKIGVEKCTRSEFNHNKTSLLYNLSVLHMQDANYEQVAEFAKEGLKLADKDSIASDQIGFLNILAKISLYNADTIATMDYWKEAYELIDSKSFYSTTAGDIVNELSMFYFTKKDYENSTRLAEKLIEIGESRQDVIDLSRGYSLLGRVAAVNGISDQAFNNIKLSLADTSKILYLTIQNDLLLTAAECYWGLGATEQMIDFIDQMERNLKKQYDLKIDRNVAKFKYEYFKSVGRNKDALVAFERYKKLYDKFLLQTNAENLLRAKAEFETDRKQLKLDKSRAENNLLEEKNRARKKTT